MKSTDTVITKTIHSKYLNEERLLKIWLPPDYKIDKPSQIIYVFDAAYYFDNVVSTIKYYSDFENDQMPQAIVVGVYFKELTDRNDVGYYPKTGKLDELGTKFYRYFVEEADRYITQEYINEPFRVFLGWSYLANYADFFLLNNPAFFDAFMLFAPEGEALNQYNISQIRQKRLYVGVGANDTEHRINNKIKLDSVFSVNNKELYRSEVIPGADHNSIVIKSLPNALEFIYKDYPVADKNFELFSQKQDNISNYTIFVKTSLHNYKARVRRSARNFARFTFLSDKKNATGQLDSLVSLFDDKNADPNLLEIIGGVYIEADKAEKAERYLRLSVQRYKDAGLTHRMFNVYKELAYNLYYKKTGNVESAIKQLQEAISVYPGFEAEFGYLICEIKIDSSKGDKQTLDQLKAYLNNENHNQPPEKIYFYLAKCSIQLGALKQGKEYLERSLEIKDNYQPSLNLKSTLKE